jgi:four helix bundle protein
MQIEDLEVYQKLFKLVLEIHELTMNFPGFELYELGSRLRRSSNSSPANLAEVFANRHTNIYLEGISRAQGEIREIKHHLRIAYEKGYITKEKLDYFINGYEGCSKMLYSLEKSLRIKKIK